MSLPTETRQPVLTALQVCPVEVAVAVLGGAWKLTVVKQLLEGTLRFGELNRRIPTVSARTLTRQLRDLERDGIVERTVYAEVPPKVEYSLTEVGRTLDPLVQQLDEWGATYVKSLESE